MGGGSSVQVFGQRHRLGSLIPGGVGLSLLAGVLAVATFSGAPAGASPPATLPAPRAVVPSAIRPGSKPELNHFDSTAGGGYVVAPPTAVTSVSATFSVPTITCTGTQAVVAPGATMVNKGGDQFGAAIDLGCRGGVQEDYIEASLNKSFKSWAEPDLDGNTFHVTITETGSVASMKVTDLTRSITKGATSPKETMTEVDYMDSVGLNPTTGKPLPTPPFTSNKFTLAEANGKPISDFNSLRYDLEYNSRIYIAPGALGPNSSFLESWQNG